VPAVLAPSLASAQQCSADDFGAIVDSAGQNLRALNADQQPKLEQALQDLKAVKQWSDSEFTENARELVQDDYVQRLDRDASELLARIERLGDAGADGNKPNCQKLDDLKAAGAELNRVMRSKWAYAFGKIDAAIMAAAGGAEGTVAAADPAATAEPVEQPEPAPDVSQEASEPPANTADPAAPTVGTAEQLEPANPEAITEWQTVAIPDAMFSLPDSPPAADAGLLNAVPLPAQTSFSIDEIQGASKGFFGTLSSELAGVIEYSFRKLGRPTGYILGNDGGGAVLAGIRYGKGRLYTPAGAYRIYWQGPSLGLDLGAEGSKTLMLVYNLKTPADALSKFGGLAGSAYVVGGVGVTFLTDGDVIVAPIRSGVGLRLGASIGYLKFTHESTWNPF